jgi:hypothetical protein
VLRDWGFVDAPTPAPAGWALEPPPRRAPQRRAVLTWGSVSRYTPSCPGRGSPIAWAAHRNPVQPLPSHSMQLATAAAGGGTATGILSTPAAAVAVATANPATRTKLTHPGPFPPTAPTLSPFQAACDRPNQPETTAIPPASNEAAPHSPQPKGYKIKQPPQHAWGRPGPARCPPQPLGQPPRRLAQLILLRPAPGAAAGAAAGVKSVCVGACVGVGPALVPLPLLLPLIFAGRAGGGRARAGRVPLVPAAAAACAAGLRPFVFHLLPQRHHRIHLGRCLGGLVWFGLMSCLWRR